MRDSSSTYPILRNVRVWALCLSELVPHRGVRGRREPPQLGYQTCFAFWERLLGGKVQRDVWVQPVIRAAGWAAHKELSEVSGRGAGAAQSKASASFAMPGCHPGGAPLQIAKIGLRKNETSLRVHDAELYECRSARAPSPEVDGPLSGQGDKKLFAPRPTCRRIEQRSAPFLQGDVSALVEEQTPRALHEHCSQSGVAVLRDASLEATCAGRVLARHETREAGDLPTIAEAPPIDDLALNQYRRQRAQALRTHGRSRRTQNHFCGVYLAVQKGDPLQGRVDEGLQEGGQRSLQDGPTSHTPPVAAQRKAVEQSQALCLLQFSPALMGQVLALTAVGPRDPLLLVGDGDWGERLRIAAQETVQVARQLLRVSAIGLQRSTILLQCSRPHDQVAHARALEPVMQTVPERARFVASEDDSAGLTIRRDQLEKAFNRHLPGRLCALFIALFHHHQRRRMGVNADFDQHLAGSAGLPRGFNYLSELFGYSF